jgi:YVTN family beta-propeller protein
MRLERTAARATWNSRHRVSDKASRDQGVSRVISLGLGAIVVLGLGAFSVALVGAPPDGPAGLGGSVAPGSASASLSPPIPTPTPTPTATNVYQWTGVGMFSPTVAADPPRVYVPDEATGTVIVIDPRTFKIIRRFRVGASPEHVTPDWDLRRLYVEVAFSNRLTVIDPRTGRPISSRTVPGPYNLYFSLDGRKALVILDSRLAGAHQVYFYDRRTWRLLKALRIPWAGADHLDFTADGRFALLSTEYSGYLVKIDIARMVIVGRLYVGGRPVDVRLAPDGRVFYVANQARSGVAIVDPVHMRQIGFLRTGSGAHGLAISRDDRSLYVTNRLAGTLSVIDFATRRVIHTWRIGGSPDMIALSPDGTRLWISNRFGGTVSVINAQTGRRIALIRTGGRPHGLAFFPEPGRLSLGHNGIYR